MDLSNLAAFRKQVAEAQASIHQLYGLQRVLEGKISDLKDLVRANANFLPPEEREAELFSLEVLKVPENITEAVKIALFLAKARKVALTPVQIKESAEQRGFDFSKYTNPMASIHTILKRMKDADPPQVLFDEDAGTYMYAKEMPFEISDHSVYDQLNSMAWTRVMEEDKDKADRIATQTIEQFMNDLKRRARTYVKDEGDEDEEENEN